MKTTLHFEVDRTALEAWAYGRLEVRRALRDELLCVCPFHQLSDTSRPDFWLNVQKGVYMCFSTSCGAAGTASELLHRLDGVPLAEAHRQLRASGVANIKAVLRQLSQTEAPVEPLYLPPIRVAELRSDNYWTDHRGLLPATCESFQLGFDFETGEALVPHYHQGGQPMCFIRRRTQKYGPRYLYPEHFPLESTVFNLHRVDPAQEVIVTEGSIDAMRVHEAGFPNVVALLGSAVKEDQVKLLSHLRLISFFDNDTAGIVATHRLDDLLPRIFKVARYPDKLCTDPDKLSHEQIRRAISRAIASVEFFRLSSSE